jgi:hypothetical protein
MIADQIIDNEDPDPDTVRPGIGQLIYEAFPGSLSHRHWHYKAFVRYQLRSTSDLSLVRPDNKAGFCLSDPAFAPDFCGSVKPDALLVDEGLGPGTSDHYPPTPGGAVHRHHRRTGRRLLARPLGELRQGDLRERLLDQRRRGEDRAVVKRLWRSALLHAEASRQSVPIALRRLDSPLDCDQASTPGFGAPDLAPKTPAELGSTMAPPAGTPPSSPVPPSAPTLSKRLARRYVVRALTKRFHRRPKHLRQACRRLSRTSFRCRVQWRYRQYRYRGSVRIFTVRVQNGFERRFDLRVRRTDRRCALAHARGCSRTFKAKNRRL